MCLKYKHSILIEMRVQMKSKSVLDNFPEELMIKILVLTGNSMRYSLINKCFYQLAHTKEAFLSYFNCPSTQYKQLALKTPLLGYLLLSTPRLHSTLNLYEFLEIANKHQSETFKAIQKNKQLLKRLDSKDLMTLGKINTSMARFLFVNGEYFSSIKFALGTNYVQPLTSSIFKDFKLSYFRGPRYSEMNLDKQFFLDIYQDSDIFRRSKESQIRNYNKVFHLYHTVKLISQKKKSILDIKDPMVTFYLTIFFPQFYSQLKEESESFFQDFKSEYPTNPEIRPKYLGALYELSKEKSQHSNNAFKLTQGERANLEIVNIFAQQASKDFQGLLKKKSKK